MSAPVLEADGLCVALGTRPVLDRVSLRLAPGCWTAIVGPNGAGKSTLLSTLAGLRPPAAGRLRLHGRPLDAWTPRERATRIAWLGQHGEAEGDLAAREVVALGRLPHLGLLGAPGPGDEAIVDASMRETECEAVLAVEAGVLLLDEPTTHLDAPHQRALLRSLRARAARGAAVATVLHDLGLALAADRLLVLVQGRVAADGPPADPTVREALVHAFGGAIRILRVPDEAAAAGGTQGRWIVVTGD
ncbi:MAG: ABC transporter ATP-binding protein [Burkholderiales bacterium]|nr:ABC transporter ATP-binding protein [Burkholderiales bacterium]